MRKFLVHFPQIWIELKISLLTLQNLHPLVVICFLEEHNVSEEFVLGEFAIGLDKAILCEPVRVETDRKKDLWESQCIAAYNFDKKIMLIKCFHLHI